MSLLDYLNPLQYVSQKEYAEFWLKFFYTFFCGFWGKVLACSLFVLALWLAVRRQRLRTAAIFYFLTFILAYGGGVYKFLLKVLKSFG